MTGAVAVVMMNLLQNFQLEDTTGGDRAEAGGRSEVRIGKHFSAVPGNLYPDETFRDQSSPIRLEIEIRAGNNSKG
jgi:hypothetical protein